METDRPLVMGPMGRALQSVRQLRWEAVSGLWVCRVPRQPETLHLVLEDWGSLCHRLRESQRYTTLLALERHSPATFGRLGSEVCRPACAHDGGKLGDRALSIAGAAGRGDVDGRMGRAKCRVHSSVCLQLAHLKRHDGRARKHWARRPPHTLEAPQQQEGFGHPQLLALLEAHLHMRL